MRRFALILCLLLIPALAAAQVEIKPALFINGSGVARGPIIAPDGSAAAPSYAFTTAPTTGLSYSGGAVWTSVAGVYRQGIGAYGLSLYPASLTGALNISSFSLYQTLNTTGVVDGVFRMAVTNTASGAGSNIMALYGGAAGTTKLFSVGMSGTTVMSALETTSYVSVGNKLVIQPGAIDGVATLNSYGLNGLTTLNFGPTTGNTARGSSAWSNGLVTIDMATATGSGTGTITSATFPAGVYLGMTCKVTTTLAGAGLTTISVGDGTDVDRWGAGIAITAGTTINVANWTAMPPWTYPAATSIVVTADAGVLSSGVLSCTPHSFTFSPIGS